MIENSVVIPVFGNEKLLTILLSTLLGTLDEQCEVIVVDDGHPNMKISEELPEGVQLLSNEKNLGFSGAVNKGINAAKGRFITTINTDILLDKEWLNVTRSIFNNYDKVGMLCARLIYPDYGLLMHCGAYFGKGYCFNAWRMSSPDFEPATKFKKLQAGSDALATMHRDSLLSVGAYDESYHTSVEDLDLCFRFQQAGFSNYFTPDIIGYHKTAASGEDRYKKVKEDKKKLFEKWKDHIEDETKEVFEISLKRFSNNGNELPERAYFFNLNRKNSEATITAFKEYSGIKQIALFDFSTYLKQTPAYYQKTKIDLLAVLPFNHLNLRYPIVYFPDYYNSLEDNLYWFENRANSTDLVFDDAFNLFRFEEIINRKAK
ncbi:glycosyltransferase family 2 protein [Roseivirga sp. BDSF3-8]|uniref:glycosyltransferase family 2 protein n=1 Tax=Roseivirga sp. BDSF3-8 TaxID=3241598 RepID=UPI0035322E61